VGWYHTSTPWCSTHIHLPPVGSVYGIIHYYHYILLHTTTYHPHGLYRGYVLYVRVVCIHHMYVLTYHFSSVLMVVRYLGTLGCGGLGPHIWWFGTSFWTPNPWFWRYPRSCALGSPDTPISGYPGYLPIGGYTPKYTYLGV